MKALSLAVSIMRDEASDRFRWRVTCQTDGITHEFSGFERRSVDARKVAAHACALCVTTDVGQSERSACAARGCARCIAAMD